MTGKIQDVNVTDIAIIKRFKGITNG